MPKSHFFFGASVVVIASVVASSEAQAQTVPSPSGADATAGVQVAPPTAETKATAAAQVGTGEIIVTARRRSESLKDVPISITAFTSQTIQQKGLNNITAVAQQTPGFQFDKGATAGDIRPSLRGIALIEGRSNVAIIVDGIDVTGVSLNTTVGGGGSQTSPTVMDLDRIEVVKGPQSVYFGRSAFAGAIQFISKDPQFNFGGSFQGTMGTFGRQEVAGNITGPIIGDTVAAKLSATYREFGGFYRNPGNGQGLGGTEMWGVGGSTLVRSGRFRGKFQLNYLHEHDNPIAGFVIPRPDVSRYGVNVIDANTFKANKDIVGISSNIPYVGNLAKTLRAIANMHYDLGGGFGIDSVSGLNKVKSRVEYDFDTKTQNTPSGTLLPGGLLNCLPGVCVGIGDLSGNLRQLSQELRLSYTQKRLRLLLGGYFFDEKYNELDYTRFVGSQSWVTGTRAGITPRPSSLDTQTYSGFGSAEFDVTPALTLTAELRYNHEIISAAAATSFNILFQTGSTAIDFRGRQGFNSLLPRFSAKYKLSNDINLYASAAKGSKPGGFNVGQVRSDLRPFGPESIWTYEAGAKGRLLDGALQFDGDIYYSDWRHVQVTTICYGTASPFGPEAACPNATAVSLNYIINANRAVAKGLELGIAAKPIRNLTLTLNYAYTDSRFKDFLARDVFPAPASPTLRQFAGNRMPLIPKNSLNGTIHLEEPVWTDKTAFVELSGRYRSSRFARFDNRVLLAAKTVADAQVGLKGDSWTALLYVNNIFNNEVPDFSRYWGNFNPSRPNGEFITAPDKREIGIRVSKNF